MHVQSYLFFNGQCEEAVEFYKQALGAEVIMLMRFKESPDVPPPGMIPDGWDDKVMHSSFRIGETTVMASDGSSQGQSNFHGFSLSLAVSSAAEADRYFNALADGGQVQMALDKTFWSSRFGMVTDRFGLGWMIIVVDESAQAA